MNKMTVDGAMTRLEDVEFNYKSFIENDNLIPLRADYTAHANYVKKNVADLVHESYLEVKEEFKAFIRRSSIDNAQINSSSASVTLNTFNDSRFKRSRITLSLLSRCLRFRVN